MKKILVIEDNLEVRENLVEILELSGFAIESAENGLVGVQKAVSNPPDLILCDVMMPELDGFGVLNIIGKKPELSHVPFIFLTAKTEKDDIRRGMNLGADDYITKPFYKDELLAVIETRLAKTAKLRQKFEPTAEGLAAFVNEAKGFEALQKLSGEHENRTFARREAIYQAGKTARLVYFVNSGKVKIFKTNDDGRELILDVFTAGQFFGYLDLINGTSYSDSAAALEPANLTLIPAADFLKLIFANKDVSARFIKMLAGQAAGREEQLLHLAYQNVRKRVAEALLKLQKEAKQPLHIHRDDLAAMVGTAKESVIRMLSEFRDDGYLDIRDGGLITILKPEKLAGMPG